MNNINLLFKKNSYFTQEAYKTLRTNLSFSSSDIKVICITSCEKNEAKSTISLELSKSLCEINKRVLLIDADMRKSVMLTKYTNESGLVGLSQYLANHVEIEDAIYSTQQPGLDVIFAGHYPPNPSELLSGKRFEELISYARQNYDYVIIDTPPLGLVIDAAVISSICDGALFIIARGAVKYSSAMRVKDQLTKSGCKILGIVMNEVENKSKRYSQGYYKYSKYSKYSRYSTKY